MLQTFKNGQGSIILRAKLLDSSSTTGAGLTGLSSASSGLIISTIADNEATATAYTVAGSTIETITTLGTYAAPTATKCRFKEVDATNHKGIYEFQFADARFSVSGAKSLIVSVAGATNLQQADFLVQLQTFDPHASVTQTGDSYARIGAAGAGLTALGDSRLGNLDAAISSRMATYTQPTGFLAATFPATVASTTNITAATGITVATNSDKTGYSLTVTPPTAIENADALLNRDMATGTDSGSPTVRTVRQALRFLRNKWSMSGATLTVTKEDDTTASWTATVSTDAAALPIVGNDPA